MGKKTYKTPGVYVLESSELPLSVKGVPTSIPAFFGYTPQAKKNGETCFFSPIKITSFSEFERIFCLPQDSESVQQYRPQYYLTHQNSRNFSENYILIAGEYYSLEPDAHSIYYMYNSVRLFYQNGGGAAYIVSVGSYGNTSGFPMKGDNQVVNPNVLLSDLLKGLAVLKRELEPSMYICPDATLLPLAENGNLMQQMLLQNSLMKTAISIFDIIGGNRQEAAVNEQDIESFRSHSGKTGLNFGTAYYPFVVTALMSEEDINYTNLFGGSLKSLSAILESVGPAEGEGIQLLKSINKPKFSESININSKTPKSKSENHNLLLTISPTYKAIISAVLNLMNILPASGGIAGAIAQNDNFSGVWKAPANIPILGVVALPIKITTIKQQDLNYDPIAGKSINAIIDFPNKGILIWGARTLAGNDNEWRYLPVRRSMLFIEQSCKTAMEELISEPNQPNTWLRIKSMIDVFLMGLWKLGALQGSKPNEAYFVRCDYGTTMTANDVQNGKLIVELGVAFLRSAEFHIISLSQQQVSAP